MPLRHRWSAASCRSCEWRARESSCSGGQQHYVLSCALPPYLRPALAHPTCLLTVLNVPCTPVQLHAVQRHVLGSPLVVHHHILKSIEGDKVWIEY